jgi:hypothetical protein
MCLVEVLCSIPGSHIVTAEGILPNPVSVEKLVKWPAPKTVTELRGILGLGWYYRHFIKDYSLKLEQLIELTKKNKPFFSTDECQEAFETLKKELTGPDIMAFPEEKGLFIRDTDASDRSIGAVPSQVQDGRERLVANGSRTLHRAERNNCVTNRVTGSQKLYGVLSPLLVGQAVYSWDRSPSSPVAV